ncbi:urokinase plasminogen activator surface receptor-like [Oncorhynchus keta]|uniref:urokinase plasminogen activator surface receptor-like n=1 Tax=Oncorhynchus keta TaxID=8018 RepID=UPI00227CBA0C|nr:urokinase plasminogen activator surface receptor-like [Oncorhynchus keta]
MITDKCGNLAHTKSFHLLQLQVKMYLIVPILVSLILPKAYSLKCFECTPGESGACTDKETDCPTQCGNTRITSYMGGTTLSDVNLKSCSVPAQCLTASVNFGMMRTMIASTCCNTDLCNSKSIPESTKTTPNGKKCFTCTGTDCTSALSCEGDEDRCISTIVNMGGEKMTMKGCASKSICVGDMSGALGPTMGIDMKCCEGNLCNNAQSIGLSLLLLVTSMVSVVLFH